MTLLSGCDAQKRCWTCFRKLFPLKITTGLWLAEGRPFEETFEECRIRGIEFMFTPVVERI